MFPWHRVLEAFYLELKKLPLLYTKVELRCASDPDLPALTFEFNPAEVSMVSLVAGSKRRLGANGWRWTESSQRTFKISYPKSALLLDVVKELRSRVPTSPA
jgi:hypothetical protein